MTSLGRLRKCYQYHVNLKYDRFLWKKRQILRVAMTYLGRLWIHLLSVSCKFEECTFFSEKKVNFKVNLDISASHLLKTEVECRRHGRCCRRAVICVMASGSCQHFESICKVLLLSISKDKWDLSRDEIKTLCDKWKIIAQLMINYRAINDKPGVQMWK